MSAAMSMNWRRIVFVALGALVPVTPAHAACLDTDPVRVARTLTAFSSDGSSGARVTAWAGMQATDEDGNVDPISRSFVEISLGTPQGSRLVAGELETLIVEPDLSRGLARGTLEIDGEVFFVDVELQGVGPPRPYLGAGAWPHLECGVVEAWYSGLAVDRAAAGSVTVTSSSIGGITSAPASSAVSALGHEAG